MKNFNREISQDAGSVYRKTSYGMASAIHMIAALTKVFRLDDSVQERLNKFALNLSKFVHTLAYGSLAIEAFKDNRVLDGVAKVIDPLISNFSSIDNINLSKGISGGLNTIDFSQAHLVNKSEGMMTNLKSSFESIKNIANEIYSESPFSKERKIFLPPSQEKGHSLAFSGHLILLSSIAGLVFKPIEKIANIVRNIGAVIANTVTMYHPDNKKKLSGSLCNIYAVLDSVQKFLPEKTAEVINNINMAIYNIGIYCYGDLSHKRTVNTFDHYEE